MHHRAWILSHQTKRRPSRTATYQLAEVLAYISRVFLSLDVTHELPFRIRRDMVGPTTTREARSKTFLAIATRSIDLMIHEWQVCISGDKCCVCVKSQKAVQEDILN